MIEGCVLGLDVGGSQTRRSSAVCRLFWDEQSIGWEIDRFRAVEPERTDTIKRIAGSAPLVAAAFDGPLTRGLVEIGRYRCAERMLTRKLWRYIGKPGQSNSPVGKELNRQASQCASIVMDKCAVLEATHGEAIDSAAIIEAYPTGYLGMLLDDPSEISAKRRNRSDVYFKHLAEANTLESILTDFLPRRSLGLRLEDIINHDSRAAWVCALTALGMALGDYTAVGDGDGWMIMPPHSWIKPWALELLDANAKSESSEAIRFVERPKENDWGVNDF